MVRAREGRSRWLLCSRSPQDSSKAAIPLHPAITMLPKRTKPVFGSPPIPESIVQEHLESIPPGTIVTEATPPNRTVLVVSIAQHDAIHQYYGTDPKHDIWKLLEKAGDMPHTLILHGTEDSAVPVEGSIEWAAAVEKKFGCGKVELHVEPGGEHGFDYDVPLVMTQ
jgi:hypothetical protein